MRPLLFVLLVAHIACLRTNPASPSPIDRELVLAPGQISDVASGLSVRFVGVFGDSRCPADAMCIQGGDAIVRIQIRTTDSTAERDLHTGDNRPVLHDGLRVELTRLEPYPFSARPIQPDDYRATLRITR